MDIYQLIKKRKDLWNEKKDIHLDEDYREAVADFIISEQGADVRVAIKDSPELLIELMFVIVDKEQRTIPFFLNEVQLSFVDKINNDKILFRQGKIIGLRYLVLKGRQQGFTSLINAYQLAVAITSPNFSGYTLADDAENTEAIFTDKGQFYFDNLPDKLKPSIKYKNRRELDFSTDTGGGLNSKWRVATAGNIDAGRSKTLSFFHGSEVAFWADAKNILIGLSEAFTKNCIVILESTANGYNEFKNLWDGDNNYINLFYEWWKTKEYVQKFEDEETEFVFKQDVTTSTVETDDADTKEWVYARCKSLIKQGLDWEQVYWYYIKWKDKGESIKQEYPCTPQEAYLASGQSFFNAEIVNNRIIELANAKKPTRGYYTYEYANNYYTNEKTINIETIQWVEDNEMGYVELFDEAVDTYMPYTIGADTAGDGSDSNIAQLIDNNQNQVAKLTVLNDEDIFTEQLFCLGIVHNEALIGVETNFSTYVNNRLNHMEYPNIYVREIRPDAITKQTTSVFGFNTNRATRPIILANLKLLVKERVGCIRDLKTLDDMLVFVVNEKGRPEAMKGEHDDTIIALAIALYIQDQQVDEIKPPPDKLEGFYLDSELEDMGYTQYQIMMYKEGIPLEIKYIKG